MTTFTSSHTQDKSGNNRNFIDYCIITLTQYNRIERRANFHQKEKEDLDEISTELELADEDEPISYKVGDSYMLLKLPRAQKMLEKEVSAIDEEVEQIEVELGKVKEEMDGLKGFLYARFGRGINLEG
ncbi:hypothetical protein BT93_L0399 [Corymbia citriodora subsp. variegata]|uniref:Prefoldin subunit 4 n=1 Tax=Corymbia citriodora subsp. variegata TaxID=360336 RepID=A0A8T0CI98_CORYI|nr:hypothetical protein BT93_L0399 [Corymbia citriodora subsp. variegata]